MSCLLAAMPSKDTEIYGQQWPCPKSRYLKDISEMLEIILKSSALFVKFSFGDDQLGLSMIKLTIFAHLAIS